MSTKDDYLAQARHAVEQLRAQIEQLRVQADLAQAEARDRLNERIDALRKLHADARAGLDRAAQAGSNAWRAAAHQAEAAVEASGDAFAKLVDEWGAAVGAASSAAHASFKAFLDEWRRHHADREKLLETE
jgi:predicted secreted Zn-dependent protease